MRALDLGDGLGEGPHAVDWDRRDDRGRPAPSGTYLLRLSAEGRSATRKILLAR